MDDKNAFERQLAAEIDYEVGPPHPVDALAITRTAKTPTSRWRTRSMFSPLKAITAAALVFTIGGVMLIAQPFDQHSRGPGAELRTTPELVPFTARYGFSSARSAERSTLPDGTTRAADAAWVFGSLEASDPRFEGNLIVNATTDTYDGVALTSHVQRIENDAGAWQEGPYFRMTWTDRDTPGDEEVLAGEARQQYFIGEGDYEGLVALVVSTEELTGGGVTLIEGYIVDGDLPPAPDLYSPPAQN